MLRQARERDRMTSNLTGHIAWPHVVSVSLRSLHIVLQPSNLTVCEQHTCGHWSMCVRESSLSAAHLMGTGLGLGSGAFIPRFHVAETRLCEPLPVAPLPPPGGAHSQETRRGTPSGTWLSNTCQMAELPHALEAAFPSYNFSKLCVRASPADSSSCPALTCRPHSAHRQASSVPASL